MAAATKATFSALPQEVRNQIIDCAVPVRRLAFQPFIDAEWASHSINCPEGRALPGLLFVNKDLYHQVAPVFYARAILEIATARPPVYIFDLIERQGRHIDLAFHLNATFAFCRRYLSRIQTVCIYSDQTDAVNAEGYEATLRWLIENTSVQNIWLSHAMKIRLRRCRANLDAAFRMARISDSLACTRAVHIYSRPSMSPWEQLRVSELRKALGNRSLPALQMYLFQQGGDVDPVICPRWDAKRSDNEERQEKSDLVTSYLGALAEQDAMPSAVSQFPARGHYSLKECLYQVCFVLNHKK